MESVSYTHLFALESNIPYGVGFIKNSYVGRTFIKPKQSARESSVNIKLNALKAVSYTHLDVYKRQD